jgi:hypothetical protein
MFITAIEAPLGQETLALGKMNTAPGTPDHVFEG